MAFKKVGNGNFKYIKYAECEAGKPIATGTYLGTRQGTYGIQHQVRDDKGDVTVLNSSGHLNYLLENNISKGDYIQVIYVGTEEMTKGKYKGKEMHQFEVGVDTDRARDASAGVVDSGSAPAAASSNDDDEEDDSEDEDDDEDEAEVAKAPTAAVVATTTRKSSEEVLAKYRKAK